MTERLIERAEAAVALETDIAVRNLQNDLRPSGQTICNDCGDPIEPARIAAAPFARRCITCQQLAEKRS